MGDLRLYAIGIDEVRDTFGADPQLRDHLRQIADRAFAPEPAPTGPPVGLLGKIGPLFRRPIDQPVIRPDQPTPADFDTLVSGQWVAPERLDATWRLFERLVGERSWGAMHLHLDDAMLNRIDFELARAGSPSHLGLAALLRSDARVGLTPKPGTVIGYRVHPHAVATADAYAQAQAALPSSDVADQVRMLVNWLNGFAHWGDLAPGLGRPVPDLIAFWTA